MKRSADILSDLAAAGITEFRLAKPGKTNTLQVKIGGEWRDYRVLARPKLWTILRDAGYTEHDLRGVHDTLICKAMGVL
jgi:hypothetical protein